MVTKKIEGKQNISDDKDSYLFYKEVNSSRRFIFDRQEVVYGKTPVGIQRKEIKKMMKVYNMNMKTLCLKIMAKTNIERYLFLKNYYESEYKEVAKFYTNFEKYTYEPNIFFNEKKFQYSKAEINNESSETFFQKPLKCLVISERFLEKKLNLSEPDSAIEESSRYCNSEGIIKTGVAENNQQRLEVKESFLNNITLCNHNIDSPNPESKNDNKSKVTSFDSVITSIFLNDSESKLKTSLKNDSLKQSSKKYDTILEKLLFE